MIGKATTIVMAALTGAMLSGCDVPPKNSSMVKAIDDANTLPWSFEYRDLRYGREYGSICGKVRLKDVEATNTWHEFMWDGKMHYPNNPHHGSKAEDELWTTGCKGVPVA